MVFAFLKQCVHDILLLLSICFAPSGRTVQDTVDVIELNHFYDQSASHVFDQVIFWEWDRWNSRYQVVAWRILRGVREDTKRVAPPDPCWSPAGAWIGGHAVPLRRHDRDGWWVSFWYDERTKRYREISAPMYRETWTQYDPELWERGIRFESERRGLREK